MKLTLPKVRTWNPPGLPKIQSLIAGVRTLAFGVFFIPLERSWSVDVQNGLEWAIWTYAAQVMGKRRAGVKLSIWLPTTRSRESTRIRRLQEECGIALESSQRELKDCFRPCPNPSSEQEVMDAQIPGSPNRDSFRTPPWESREKVPFECSLRGERQRILYGGRSWLPPSPGRGESSESKVARGLSQHQKSAEWVLTNLLVGFGCRTK
jgi:hypothetical protein